MCSFLTPHCQASTVCTLDMLTVGQRRYAWNGIFVEVCKHDCDTDVLDSLDFSHSSHCNQLLTQQEKFIQTDGISICT
jgi:hypothetical protein